jgi:hypothetical protein
MNSEDLDRILASEEPLEPSSGFAASVMTRVREAAAEPPPLPFPWLRFVLGALVLAALAGFSGWMIATSPAARTSLSALAAMLSNQRVSAPVATTVASLVGTYLLVRITLSWTGARG